MISARLLLQKIHDHRRAKVSKYLNHILEVDKSINTSFTIILHVDVIQIVKKERIFVSLNQQCINEVALGI